MKTYPHHEIIYRIDETDCITYVSPERHANSGGHEAAMLTPDEIIGRPVLSFVADKTARYLMTLIFDRIRHHRMSVVLPYNCNSPHLKQCLEITISPFDNSELEVSIRTKKELPRDQVPILKKIHSTPERFLSMCSWCNRVNLPMGDWVEVEEAVRKLQLFEYQPLPKVTHGVCMNCEQQIRATLEHAPHKR